MKAVSRVLDIVCFVAKTLSAIFLAVMLVVSLVEIIRRYFMGFSFPWADELIRYCIVGVASLGGAAAFREVGGLVSFDLIQTHARGRVRFLLELAINTIVLGFAAYMLRNSILNLINPSITRQISIGLKISMFWPYLPITVGMTLFVTLALEKYACIVTTYRAGGYNRAIQPPGEGESIQ